MVKLTPKQQALAEIVLLLASAVLFAFSILAVIEFGLFMYVGYAMIAYGAWGLLKFYYDNRVSILEEEAKKLDK